MQEDTDVEPLRAVTAPLRVSSQRVRLVTPIEDFHFPFSQGSQEVPMRVSPALQVHEESSPILEKDGIQSQDCSSFWVSCWGQRRQEEAPTEEKDPSGQIVHVSLAPMLKVFLGQMMRVVRSREGMWPALAVLQKLWGAKQKG
jgi:hypothetical protein